jgi:hypothetical protein
MGGRQYGEAGGAGQPLRRWRVFRAGEERKLVASPRLLKSKNQEKEMTKLISMIVAALFAAASVNAIAASHMAAKGDKGDKMEKSDGKMDKKDDGKKAAPKKAAPKKAAPKKAAPKMEEKK